MMMPLTALHLALFASLLITATSAQSNNAQWGYLQYDSALSYNNHIERGSRVLQTVEERVTYPPPGVISNRPIHAIRAYDRKTNGNGATAEIVAGGLNQTSVTIRFTSKRGHGIDFQLEIYAPACKN